MPDTLRKVEVLREGVWVRVRLADVKKGETFSIELEPDVIVKREALSDGYWCDMSGTRTLQAQLDKTNAAIMVNE